MKKTNKFRKCLRAVDLLLLAGTLLTSCASNNGSYEYISYYPDHTYSNEANYKTVLADLSKIKEGEPSIALKEQSVDCRQMKFNGFTKDSTGSYDVRFVNISKQDLSFISNYNDLTFNSKTVWPKVLPDGFDPDEILEFNKNPGLGIRALHEQGITGSGVGIAIIDQAILIDHEQYKDNLMFYERIHCVDYTSSMHGPALASIAVGKTIGVAPDSKLYHIASTFWHYDKGATVLDFSITADCIDRILEVNKLLPENEKIRVIAISWGMSPQNNGYKEFIEAVERADKQNVFVVTTSTKEYYKNFVLGGIDRDYLADPDDFGSYKIASWLESSLYQNSDNLRDSILFPMGSRTYASSTGEKDYEIQCLGGLSWAVPWCAGLYALCCQVKPDITPQEFIEVVSNTSVPLEVVLGGKTYQSGKMVNPAGVIKTLQEQQS